MQFRSQMHPDTRYLISFPNGAGGNWLAATIMRGVKIADDSMRHWHGESSQHWDNASHSKVMPFLLEHETDPAYFSHLFSGSLYFNFYLNFVYKFGIIDGQITKDYHSRFIDLVNSAKFICLFEELKDRVHFDFDNLLLDDPVDFYNKVTRFQSMIDCNQISFKDFKQSRDNFIKSCVNPSNIYENFDNLYWVAFVVGQLMNQNIVPTSFSIFDQNNFELCKQFAFDNYDKCAIRKVHYFNNNIFMPEYKL